MTQQARKILIAMDGSKHSDYAFDWFMRYFYKDRDDVIILHCAEQGVGLNARRKSKSSSADAVKLSNEDDDEVSALLVKLQAKIQGAGIKGNVLRVLGAKPGDAIVKTSDEQKVDIIITGTRGHGAIHRTLIGSVSQYVVHNAHCPVLVVRHD